MVANPKTLSLVSYAVNGHGVGHLMRMIAINRWIRRYGQFFAISTQHWFLTSSEADTLLHREGFAGFKMPSKSVVQPAGIDKLAYLALAKQWVWNSMSLLRPDIFLVDTFPNGSFHELMPILDLCAHKALVLRPVRAEFVTPSFRAIANLYDRILVPGAREEAAIAHSYGLDSERLRFVGPVFRGETFERHDRNEARQRLGIPEQAQCLLVSAGGGGDELAAALFRRVEAIAAERPDLWIFFAAGPLFCGRPHSGARRIWWTGMDLAEHMLAFDGAVIAGGFNTVYECLFAGLPCVIVSQDKVADDQRARGELMRNTGAARLALLDDDSLGPALAALLDQPRKSELDRSERAPISQNCARQAAIEVMRLAAPDLRYDDAVEGLDDHLLGEARRGSIDLGDLCEVARGLAGQAPRSATHDPTLALDASLRLLVHSRSIAMQTPSLMRLLNACAAKVGAMNESAAEEFADAMIALMAEPGIAAQASVLNLFLRILPSDRSVEGAPFIQRLHKLLVVAKTRQLDLFALARIAQEHADAGRNGGLLAFLAGIDDELRGQEGMRR